MSTVAIIDYGSGNLHSAAKAFEVAGRAVSDELNIHVTGDPDIVATADRIVLPGVGAFGDCLTGLNDVEGMRAAMEEAVKSKGRPFFGICVGMQLLAERGLEKGEFQGLGWLAGHIAKISPDDNSLKIPHMGWNTLSLTHRDHPVLRGIDDGDHVYFVHSYAWENVSRSDLLAQTDYGGGITAMVGRDNVIGAQFHPEKSQRVGLRLIENFLRWRPS